MSTSINPEKFMPNLLHLLSKAKEAAETDSDAARRFEEIKRQLEIMTKEDLLARVKLFDQTLLSHFTTIERCLGMIVLEAKTTYRNIQETKKALDFMDENVEKIRKQSTPLLELTPHQKPGLEQQWHRSQPNQLDFVEKMSDEWSQLGLEDIIHETSALAKIRRLYEELESNELKVCFLSFSIFPDDSGIKKRPLIYWWIGEGFVKSSQWKTAEEEGEEIFKQLMRKGFIQQTSSDASSRAVTKDCKMHPWIRRMLISLAGEARLFNFDSRRMRAYDKSTCRRACLVYDPKISQPDKGLKEDDLLTVFNLNVLYLNLKKEWLSKLNKVAVLQLGRWQNSATYHIELEDEDSLKGLGAQKQLKYLSLRGISRITRLPSSIFRLSSLEILDLRACHNLERLPSGISSLKNLTHLDISECYLLEGMPKGLEKLTSLQVLKGFVIGSLKSPPGRIGDLTKLNKLKRLSIHMGNEAEVEDKEFQKLKELSSLRRLKISWGVVSKKLKEKIMVESLEFLFPPDLEKLNLQGMPLTNLPKWLKPSQLKKLKKLYIRGGELTSLEHGEIAEWTVEILRLKQLRNLKIGLPLNKVFPHLQHWEMIKCSENVEDTHTC